MEQRRKWMVVGLGALALVATTIDHPTADLRILTHDAGDPSPHRFQAALDLGLMGASVLVTWTAKRLR